MNSISFPKLFNGTKTEVKSDYYATLQNIKMLLSSYKGELFGDPYYGTEIKKHLFDQNDSVLADIVIDDIYGAIKLFIPQIIVNRSDIKVTNNRSNVSVKIKAINRSDFTTNMFNIVLLESEV